MNRTDIDYIIEKLESYKPDNIYDGYNSEREKQDQRVSEVLDSIIAEIKSDYENNHMPASKELVLTCKLDEEQMQRLKEQIESAKMSIEPVEESKWIKCSDRMPEHNESVLVVIKEDGYTDICVGETFGEDNWMISGEHWYEKSDPAITHWMPLPSMEGLDDAT